ncbi:MAG: hypothetical protein NUV74_04650 [Candidatus Brocadiaceae bacterium]|nr:hypothetical protein [Candidatus Brocadiaceae bacterium]
MKTELFAKLSKSLLERRTALKIKYASQSNPLTGLPGNISIKTFVEKQIKMRKD